MLKKLIAPLLSILLLLTAMPVFASASAQRYVVTAEHTNILDRAGLLGGIRGELQKGDYVYVSEVSGDFSYVTVNASGISGWVYTPYLDYAGMAASPEGYTGIRIFRAPDKLTYIEDEEAFDVTGLIVSAQRQNADEIRISGYKVYVPDLDSAGQKKVYVVYRPEGTTISYSAGFDITVNRVPLTGITVTSPPSKATDSYIEAQSLDLTGLTLKATYSDGRPDRTFTSAEILADKDFVVTGCHSEAHGKKLVKGTHTINIYYKYPEVSCSLTVKARQRTLTAFEITAPPAKTTVYEKTVPDLTGLKLTATYDNGETVNVPPDKCAITCDPSAFILGKGNKMTLTYEGKSVTLDFTYALLEKTGLQLKLPQVLTFVLGEPIDLSALEVYYVYSDDSVEKTAEFTRDRIDPMKTGAQTIPVSAGDFSTTFTIFINPWYQRGDIDGSGKVDSADARLALRSAVGLIKLGGVQLRAADVDKDGKVTAADARLILRAAVGLEDLLAHIRNTTI